MKPEPRTYQLLKNPARVMRNQIKGIKLASCGRNYKPILEDGTGNVKLSHVFVMLKKNEDNEDLH